MHGFLINFSKSREHCNGILTFYRIKREVVNEYLRSLIAAVSNATSDSVPGISFQARYSPTLLSYTIYVDNTHSRSIA